MRTMPRESVRQLQGLLWTAALTSAGLLTVATGAAQPPQPGTASALEVNLADACAPTAREMNVG
jgi:hypothetical protein